MATQQERLALQEASKRYTGKDFGVGGFDQAFEDSGVSATNRIREILNSSEAQQYGQQLASNQFAPQISQVDQATASTTSDMDTLIKQLQQQQQAAPEQTFNDFNRRGLFRSSMAQKAVANTVGQLGSQIGNAQIQRSTRLADLAAQRASLLNKQTQFANDFTSGNRSAFEQNVAEQEAAQQKAAYEQQLAQMKLQTALAQASNRGGGSGTGSTILDSWLAGQMGGGQQPQQQQESFDPNETLPDFTTAGPTNPNPVQQGPSAWQQFTQPRSVQDQLSLVKSLQPVKATTNFLKSNPTPYSALMHLFGR